MSDGNEAPIRWGILSTGHIAGVFAADLALVPGAELVAVGSRSQGAAERFGEQYGVPRRYASYEALAADPEVDIIYVATPHPFHAENTLLCLEAGKAVLCEKPFAMNARETRAMIEAARARGLFLMEAMWSRFLPVLQTLRALLAQGAIGELRMLRADFGDRPDFEPTSRLFAPELGGGALLDIGIYPVSLASMVFGTPTRVESVAHLGRTGVDEQAAIALGYEGGQLASLTTSFQVKTGTSAEFFGTAGRISLPSSWFNARHLCLAVEGEPEQIIEAPFEGKGYQFEAMEAGRCLREGLLDSPVMPLAETLAIMETLDTLRAQWGLRYPMEER